MAGRQGQERFDDVRVAVRGGQMQRSAAQQLQRLRGRRAERAGQQRRRHQRLIRPQLLAGRPPCDDAPQLRRLLRGSLQALLHYPAGHASSISTSMRAAFVEDIAPALPSFGTLQS
jgi:hypothetical protein